MGDECRIMRGLDHVGDLEPCVRRGDHLGEGAEHEAVQRRAEHVRREVTRRLQRDPVFGVSHDRPQLFAALECVLACIGEVQQAIPFAPGDETVDRAQQRVEVTCLDQLLVLGGNAQLSRCASLVAARWAIP